MNSKILVRYDITSDNRFIIDVNIPTPDELFEQYDYNASFYKKDLNTKFEEYLLECVEEIGLKNKFIIRIALPEDQAKKTDEGDIIYSFKQFFKYCILTCQKEIKKISSRMLLHLGFAVLALVFMMIFNSADTETGIGVFHLIASGLPAAIWVILLTGLSRFLFRIMSQGSQIKMYLALKKTPVEFVYKEKQLST